MTIETKQAEEFGRTVTLYRAIDGTWSSLWHSTEERAVAAWERRGQRARTEALAAFVREANGE